MKTRSAQVNPGASSNHRVPRSLRLAGLFVFAVAVVFAATAAPVFSWPPAAPQAAQTTTIPDVKCVIGLTDIKPNTTGTVTMTSSGLEFATSKKKAAIPTASITDIFTGNQSRQDISGMGGTAVKAAIPYGGGRILSLFSHKVEVLTIEYVDSNGGFHGAILVLPPGHASALKDQLVAQGAKVTPHVEPPEPKEQKP